MLRRHHGPGTASNSVVALKTKLDEADGLNAGYRARLCGFLEAAGEHRPSTWQPDPRAASSRRASCRGLAGTSQRSLT